jgi:4-diphosphocytidyl-2-C-methyl-D-erythritol kinase
MRSAPSCSRALATTEALAGGMMARAKVNLYLHVTGRRADGYHELDSLFVRTDLCDRLALHPAEADSLTVEGPFAAALAGEAPEGNLALRAVSAVRGRCGRSGPVAVTLEKNIPVAAGLGGGSADAAAALRATNTLFDAGLDEAALAELAAGLGADVPPCLHDMPLAVRGIGDILTPLACLPGFALLLVNPRVALATADVFRARTGGFSRPAPMTTGPGDLDGLVAALAERQNDLEAAAMTLAPAVGEVLESLRSLPGARLARMSGSGATCFALFADLAGAEAGQAALARTRPGWWAAATGVAGTR